MMASSNAMYLSQHVWSILYFALTASATPVAKPLASTSTTSAAAETSTTYNEGSDYGQPGGGNSVNTDAGASGSDNGSFTLSRGAIAAIAVVVALVVIIGIVTTVLFFIAKKRQWQVKKSIRRASRRVASKISGKQPREDAARKARRHGAVRLRGESGKYSEKNVSRYADKQAVELTKTKNATSVVPSS